jgi:hypothetical protein
MPYTDGDAQRLTLDQELENYINMVYHNDRSESDEYWARVSPLIGLTQYYDFEQRNNIVHEPEEDNIVREENNIAPQGNNIVPQENNIVQLNDNAPRRNHFAIGNRERTFFNSQLGRRLRTNNNRSPYNLRSNNRSPYNLRSLNTKNRLAKKSYKPRKKAI